MPSECVPFNIVLSIHVTISYMNGCWCFVCVIKHTFLQKKSLSQVNALYGHTLRISFVEMTDFFIERVLSGCKSCTAHQPAFYFPSPSYSLRTLIPYRTDPSLPRYHPRSPCMPACPTLFAFSTISHLTFISEPEQIDAFTVSHALVIDPPGTIFLLFPLGIVHPCYDLCKFYFGTRNRLGCSWMGTVCGQWLQTDGQMDRLALLK